MKILDEFKTFAIRGNVVDMAIGVVIGGAFGKITTSLVSDIIMPPIGRVLGNVDFSNLFISLTGATYPSLAEAQKAGAATLNYGMFLNQIINFIIVAFTMFLVIKGMNALKKKEAAAPTLPPAPSRQEVLLEEIRDLLKKKA